jgi:hypothetical protein
MSYLLKTELVLCPDIAMATLSGTPAPVMLRTADLMKQIGICVNIYYRAQMTRSDQDYELN